MDDENTNNNQEIVGVVLDDLGFGDSGLVNNIARRFDAGHEKYGHGINVHHDTTRYGTLANDWVEMAHRECLDCLIYLAASEVRRGRESAGNDLAVREKLSEVRKKLIDISRDLNEMLETGSDTAVRRTRPPVTQPNVMDDVINRIELLETWQQNVNMA